MAVFSPTYQDIQVKAEPVDEDFQSLLSGGNDRNGSNKFAGVGSSQFHHQVNVKSEPEDPAFYIDGPWNHGTVKLEDVDGMEYDGGQTSVTGSWFMKDRHGFPVYASEAPQLRHLLSKPAEQIVDVHSLDISVNWISNHLTKGLSAWEEQIQNAEDNPQDRLLENPMMRYQNNELLWRLDAALRKRTYETMVQEAMCNDYSGGTDHVAYVGINNPEKENESDAFPASAALKKMCTGGESRIRSLLTTTPPKPPDENARSPNSQSVIRTLLTTPIIPPSKAPSPRDKRTHSEAKRRRLNASPKRDSSPDLKSGEDPSPRKDTSTIRSLLTAPLPPVKTVQPDNKSVLLNLLREPNPLLGLHAQPAVDLTVLDHTPPGFNFNVMTSHYMSAHLRRLLNAPQSPLIAMDDSEKFNDVVHVYSEPKHETVDTFENCLHDLLPTANTNADATSYPCPECHKTFADEHDLLEHSVVHDNDSYMCSECGDEFTKKRALLKHKRKHHKIKLKFSKTTSDESKGNIASEYEAGWVDRNSSDVEDDITSSNGALVKGSWQVTGGGETFRVEENEDYDSDV